MKWLEEHPYLAGSLVLVAIVGFFLLRGSGGGSSSGGVTVTGAPQADPNSVLAANTSIQQSQIASGVAMQQTTAAATVAQNQTNAQVAMAQIAANASAVQTQLQTNAQIQQTLTSGQVALGQQATDIALAQVQTGGQIQLAGIDLQKSVDLAQIARAQNQDDISGNLAYANIEANQAITINGQNTGAQVAVAGLQAQTLQYQAQQQTQQAALVTKAQADQQASNNDLAAYIASLQAGVAINQTNQTAGVQNNYINTAGAVAITQSNNQTAVQLGQQKTLAPVLNSLSGAISNSNGRSSTGIAQIISSLFGTQQPTPQNSGFNFGIPGVISVGVTNP